MQDPAPARRAGSDSDDDAPDDLPGRDAFVHAAGLADSRAAGRLRVLLARLRVDAPLADHLEGFERLGHFVVAGPPVPATHSAAYARLDMLVQAVERVPAARTRVTACLAAVIGHASAVNLLAVIGLPNDRGLLAETADRLARRLLPAPPDDRDLAEVLGRFVRRPGDHAWLADVALEPLLTRLVAATASVWAPLAAAAADAVGLISTRVAALGLSEQLRARTEPGPVRESPFYHLGRAAPADLPPLIAGCRRELGRAHDVLEHHGVSVDVVYTLDAIERELVRIERLLPLATGRGLAPAQLRQLLADLGGGLVGERRFRDLLADNLRLMARKVIERAGRTGEHYVTSSRREYFRMLGTAAGGGVITAGTAITKFLIKWGQFPMFIDGLLSSVAYAGSFLVIQFLGFTLATKQPSMTAAALAGTIRDTAGPDRLRDLVALIARIARSQFAAAVGNVATVIVVAMIFDALWAQATGAPFLSPKGAEKTMAGFHPFGSGTIPFAALTGVLLWMSSLVAGWFENWVVYRRLPEAIEHHRLGRRLGRARMARAARFVERQAAGFGGSVALGFFLGMTPAFAAFVGLPLDVRHVTLSAGSLTLAISSTGVGEVGWEPIVWGWLGIAVIGLLNFGVSFLLALLLALRARDVPRGERRTLPWAVLRHFLRRPHTFFWPPKDPPGTPAAPAHH